MLESILAVYQIQANVAPGFRLPHQRVVALGAGAATAREVARLLLPRLTTMAEAVAYHRRRIELAKELRAFGRRSFGIAGGPSGLRWLNVAIGAAPLLEVGFGGPAAADRSFATGLPARSAALGDPKRPGEAGHKDGWIVGAPSNPIALLLILGSDELASLEAFGGEIEAVCRAAGATVLHAENGARLDGDIEHFGFRDGISQPGVRGRVSAAPDNFLTRRKLPVPADEDAPELAAPGEVLVWPGEFIFGYPTQDPHHFRRPSPVGEVDPFLIDGSFLVFRRLRQHVGAFRRATRALAEELRAFAEYAHVSDDWLRTHLVGRWPSGAPLLRFPHGDPGPPPGSLGAFNHFAFRDATPAVTTGEGEPISGADADPSGLVVALHAHIRKVNPRDVGTNLGPASQTQKLRLLRRGIPYGPPAGPGDADDGVDRGLFFLSYQRSIREQFEKLVQDWMNSDLKPEGDRGHDVLVGQAGRDADGRACVFARSASGPFRRIATRQDWITPTGGGYFFCPSAASLAAFAGAPGEV